VPTFEALARFNREFRRLSPELRHAFLAMLPLFITALRESPPAFPAALRVHRVQRHPRCGVFECRAPVRCEGDLPDAGVADEPHVIWRRIGTHAILAEP
jgi:hypothetical protein